MKKILVAIRGFSDKLGKCCKHFHLTHLCPQIRQYLPPALAEKVILLVPCVCLCVHVSVCLWAFSQLNIFFFFGGGASYLTLAPIYYHLLANDHVHDNYENVLLHKQ